jgi:hypothetical protein
VQVAAHVDDAIGLLEVAVDWLAVHGDDGDALRGRLKSLRGPRHLYRSTATPRFTVANKDER